MAGFDISVGHRWRRFEPVFTLDAGVGRFDRVEFEQALGIDLERARLSSLGVGLGVLLYPRLTSRGVADPYFDVGLGFSGVWLNMKGNGFTLRDWVPRGAIRIGGGVDLFATERFSLGPGFRVSVPFAGYECIEIQGGGETLDECVSMRELEEQYGYPASELPLIWMVMFRARYVWRGRSG